MRKLYSKTITAILLLGVILISHTNLYACTCFMKLICEAYSAADAVFIGKLEKLEENPPNSAADVMAYFQVERTFKGKTGKTEQVGFNLGCDQKLMIGETYFVYKESSEYITACPRTDLFSRMRSDLKYAESLSETNPIFTISGLLTRFSKDELKTSEVWIVKGQNKKRLKIDDDGNYEYVAKEKGLYRIKIFLPLNTEISMKALSGGVIFLEGNGFKIVRTKNQTEIEYDLNFKPNSCSFREISKMEPAESPE